jgi:hypothetical protein
MNRDWLHSMSRRYTCIWHFFSGAVLEVRGIKFGCLLAASRELRTLRTCHQPDSGMLMRG